MIFDPDIPLIGAIAVIVFVSCFFGGGYLIMGFHDWNELVFSKKHKTKGLES